MPSKNQVRRVIDFRCPSLEFLPSRIGEEKSSGLISSSQQQKLKNKEEENLNKKMFTSQEEACQRSKEESLNLKAAQQMKKQGLDLQKLQFLKKFCAKRGWRSAKMGRGRQAQKTHKKVQKLKISIKFRQSG